MSKENYKSQDSEFAESIALSITNISNVWKQINCLKSTIDQKIEVALKDCGFAAKGNGTRVIPRELGDKWDEYGSVCERWAWSYPVKNAGTGRPTNLGQLYFSIALTPSHTEATKDFRPYISVSYDDDVHYNSADWENDFLDWNHPTINDEFYREKATNFFPCWAIYQSLHYDDENEINSPIGFGAYLPLNRITSETIDSAIISPTIKALKCVTGL